MPRKQYEPTERDLQIVQELKEKGSSDKDIALVIGVSYSTFKKYKKSLFDLPIKRGLETRTETLLKAAEDGLLKLVSGYHVTETLTKSKDGVAIEHITKTRYVQPNATSVIFTLCNLDPENWRHVNKIEPPCKNSNENSVVRIEWV